LSISTDKGSRNSSIDKEELIISISGGIKSKWRLVDVKVEVAK
jgi:hypothetical protein